MVMKAMSWMRYGKMRTMKQSKKDKKPLAAVNAAETMYMMKKMNTMSAK